MEVVYTGEDGVCGRVSKEASDSSIPFPCMPLSGRRARRYPLWGSKMEPNGLRMEETAFPPPVRVQTDTQTEADRSYVQTLHKINKEL